MDSSAMMMLWNLMLTVVVGIIGYILKDKFDELQRLSNIMINNNFDLEVAKQILAVWDGFEKYKLGWLNQEEYSCFESRSGSFSLSPINSKNNKLKLIMIPLLSKKLIAMEIRNPDKRNKLNFTKLVQANCLDLHRHRKMKIVHLDHKVPMVVQN